MLYEPTKGPHFRIEQTGTGELFRIRAARPIFAMLFLPVWLVGWTIGGIAAIRQVMETGEPFLFAWLCGWALGWVAAASAVSWMAAGSETIRVVAGDLEIAHQLFGWRRPRLFRGSEIRRLGTSVQRDPFARSQIVVPFVTLGRMGSIRFDHGARTIYAVQGVDEAEGQMLVERLSRKLPSAAAE